MSQKQDILNYLKQGNTLTKLEALRLFGCMNLGGRILELRTRHSIETQMINVGEKRVAEYRLVSN